MNQQPDKFFRDRLENLQRPAPASAWDRIEAGIEKKTKPVWLWYKIAAAILLLAVASFLLWPASQARSVEHTATKNDKPVIKKENTTTSSGTPAVVEKVAPTQTAAIKKESQPIKKSADKAGNIKQEDEINVTQNISPEVPKELPNENIVTPLPPQEQPVVAVAETKVDAPQNNNVKIIITADDASKYLNKKSVAQATSPEKKTSTFKKLLEKAEDLTTNQDPIGEIRQKKDELLALNFRNDKRGQNK